MSASPTAVDATANLRNDSSAETLDQVVSTTSARLWIALVAALVLIAAGVGWAFLAQIPARVTVTGLVLQRGSTVVVPSPVEGGVRLLSSVLSHVGTGDPVAVITPFDATQPPVTLVSPMTGIISDVLVQEGSGVTRGQSVFVTSAADTAPKVRVLALVPASAVHTFVVGATVDVNSSSRARTPTQDMDGTIASVSDVPAQVADLAGVSGSSPVAEILNGRGAEQAYLVVVEVERTDLSGAMRNGEIVTVVNTYGSMHPFDAITQWAS